MSDQAGEIIRLRAEVERLTTLLRLQACEGDPPYDQLKRERDEALAVVEAAQLYWEEARHHIHNDPECSGACLSFQSARSTLKMALAAWEANK